MRYQEKNRHAAHLSSILLPLLLYTGRSKKNKTKQNKIVVTAQAEDFPKRWFIFYFLKLIVMHNYNT